MPTATEQPLEFRDSAIEDMLGRPPGWLLRSGIGMIAILLAVSLFLANVISYPERVEATFVLQTEKLPLAVSSGTAKYVQAILKNDRSSVLPGDTLLVFRSDGDWRTIRYLHRYLEEVQENLNKLSVIPMLNYPSLVAPAIGDLNATLQAYHSYDLTNGVAKQIEGLEKEIRRAKELKYSLGKQVNLYNEELKYQDRNVERARTMKREGVISTQEADAIEQQTILAYRQREVLIASDVQNSLRIDQLNQQILRLQLDHLENKAEFKRQIFQQYQLLRTAVDKFSLQNFIIAEEAGMIDWMPEVREGTLIGGGGALGYLIPEQITSSKVARITLPPRGSGRVEVGNRVFLGFDAYPPRQYGQVIGVLMTIDAVAQADESGQFARQATIALTDTLRTSYDREISFQYNLTGTARIITQERTLLDRLVDQMFNLKLNQ